MNGSLNRPGAILAFCALLIGALAMVIAQALGAAAPGSVVTSIQHTAATFGALGLVPCAVVLLAVGNRIRQRRVRAVERYQLAISQADEASVEDVATAYEQLVQIVRTTRLRRLYAGQPWLAIESWFVPPHDKGETGVATLMLVCSPLVRESAMAALRHAYPDLAIVGNGMNNSVEALPGLPDGFTPHHVMRVRKVRAWALPVGMTTDQREASNSHSTMAAIIRQQQQAGRLSCVRWCLLPAGEGLDSRAPQKLERIQGQRRDAAIASDVSQASRAAGGAMAFLELQAAVQRCAREAGEPKVGQGFMKLHAICRQLLSPALSQRGANHLRERLMIVRQSLYRRRWLRAEPPLLTDPRRCTLFAPREVAMLMALPSLGSEHALPLQRNTVPHLPIPVEVPRAHVVEMPWPPASVAELPSPEFIHTNPTPDGQSNGHRPPR
jgi:hypothetical protein